MRFWTLIPNRVGVEGAGSKPLSVHLSAGHIQLSILPVPVDAIQDCLDLLQRGCSFHLHSDNLFLSDSQYTSDIVRFYYRADLPRSPTLIGPLASWRGDFPQCRTLSVTLLLPHISEEHSSNELLGQRISFDMTIFIGNHHGSNTSPEHHGRH